MEEFHGKSIYKGIAIGNIFYYNRKSGGRNEQKIERRRAEDKEAEKTKFNRAREISKEQLKSLYNKALSEVGEVNAEIFNIHAMLADDEDFTESVYNIINEHGMDAVYAVASTADNFAEMFEQMDDEYFRARAIDIRDVSERIINNMKGEYPVVHEMPDNCIVVADDLTPSETVQLDRKKVKAFVIRDGSANSHTAILARTMNIPAITSIDGKKEWDKMEAVVDGNLGQLILMPDEKTKEEYMKKMEDEEKLRELLKQYKGKPDITADGKDIKLYANIGDVTDMAEVLENDAAGIGLFRSEFLYIGRNDYPDEDVQFRAYKKVAETMAGKNVIIRTLDIGADKQADYFGLEKEENPALGFRAIRICIADTKVFRTQLRAILRASAYGNVSVMYPMITSLWEVKKCKEIFADVREELRRDGIPVGDVSQGIMIETPAAAVISDVLADEVDFFSIGTNDLTQYVLAVDRQNPRLDDFYDPHHEAVFRLIKYIADSGHKAGIWVGICGELAADTEVTERLIKMGIDELSVAPPSILKIRKIISESTT